jgi:hypothetical protein
MGRLISYPVLSTISSEDWIPVSDISTEGNPLRNVTVSALSTFFNENGVWAPITGGINYSGGKVGINTDNPQGTLNIVNDSPGTWSLRLTAADGGDMGGFLQDSSNNTELILKEGGGSGNVVLNSLGKSYIAGGNFGIGTGVPNSKCHIVGDPGFTALRVDGPTIAEDDIEIQNSFNGVILKSPDGTRYRITVANGGTLTVTAV